MKHIVMDCDNTLGVPNCDVDDGLALIYLLGCKQAKVHGITTTYGNNQLDVVYQATKKLRDDVGRPDIIIKKGGSSPTYGNSEAADYLVEMAHKYPGELSILATGSLTNLKEAYKKDADFFNQVKEIVLMGGITSPLIFQKKQMNELNFSCDPKAAYLTLTKGHHVSVITGNHCLKVLFTKNEYKKELADIHNPMACYIKKETNDWFGYNEMDYGIDGFYNWDVTAAVYLMHPELFIDHHLKFQLSQADLRTGFLRMDLNGSHRIHTPEIKKSELFKQNIYEHWLCVPVN
ncbi:MAG: nucleoside hydrolase [Lachnospiraceae bacterium]